MFGKIKVKDVDEVWANWEKIKKAEKHGTKHARHSVLDGIPKHLPALMRAEKLVKKARKAKLLAGEKKFAPKLSKASLRSQLFWMASAAQQRGWSAEELLTDEIKKQERQLRKLETSKS